MTDYVHCQKNSFKNSKKNTIYVEFFGNSATYYSVHYDRMLTKKKRHTVDISLGFGYTNYSFSGAKPCFAFPISLNWSKGKRNNHLDLGLGLTYNSGVIQYGKMRPGDIWHTLYYQSMEAIWCSFRLGYKYQKPMGGFFFRVGFTPLIKLIEFSSIDYDKDYWFLHFIPLIGLGGGYTF